MATTHVECMNFALIRHDEKFAMLAGHGRRELWPFTDVNMLTDPEIGSLPESTELTNRHSFRIDSAQIQLAIDWFKQEARIRVADWLCQMNIGRNLAEIDAITGPMPLRVTFSRYGHLARQTGDELLLGDVWLVDATPELLELLRDNHSIVWVTEEEIAWCATAAGAPIIPLAEDAYDAIFTAGDS